MKFATALLSAALAVAVAASPVAVEPPTAVQPLEKRATTMCGSYGSLQTGAYTIFHNNWGAAQATSGSQCTTFTSLANNVVVWSTSWTWAGGAGQVKSYSNVALEAVNKKISAITSIPSVWTWRYTGTNIVADVSYDMWLAPSTTANNEYEIMVWLAAYGGAGPISATGSPVATPTIGGTTWSLYKGTNGATTVFSFVAPSHLGNYNGDLLAFFTYLTTSQGVSSSQYITAIQAGTEPFSGTSAVLTTYAYSAVVN
ncbi:hypothetical protein BP5796_10106 [Coleophoma crateriformis]|uniref:Glycoside hydrolase family 12 protein n=1 Tax=Coleophoma crateriformis TaxID=565419 RepID=A0A3D8QV88_9HELO|nr:hypothetical protein BP5796_10106 [Coleophoma crateriformis]